MYDSSGDNSMNCSLYTSKQKTIILAAMGGTGACSISLSIVALLFVFCYKLHKKFAYRLAAYQVLSSMLLSMAVLVAAVPLHIHSNHSIRKIFCQASGFLLEYFMWVNLLQSLCLLFHIFCLAVFLRNLRKLETSYVVISVCLPLFFTWIPFLRRSYGETESWCWIKGYKNDCKTNDYLKGIIEQFAMWYGPLSICIIISLIAILLILVAFKYRYNKLSGPSEEDPLLENCMKRYMLKVYFRKLIPLLIYPVVFFALFVLPVVKQIHHTLYPESFGLSLAQSVCYASVGSFSGVVLILHVLLARRLKSWNEYFFHDHAKQLGSTVDDLKMRYDEGVEAVVIESPNTSLSQSFGASMMRRNLT